MAKKMQKRLRFATLYKTDADYLESWMKMNRDSRITTPDESKKGHITFRFKDSNSALQLMESTGTLIVHWHDKKDKQMHLPLLKEVLVKSDGSPAEILPSSANVFNISYDSPPLSLSFAWCKDKLRYVAPMLVAKSLLVNFAFGILAMFLFFCFFGTFGAFGAFALSCLLVGVVWDEFKKKFGNSARLASSLTKHL
jgi:hypothetical protein